MNDFFQTVPIKHIFEDSGCAVDGRNFEDAYDEIVRVNDSAARTVQAEIEDYFSKLELPDEPTIYDMLVLSLRPMDIIATFNWDPFLIQAARRNYHVSKPPQLLFLHGNVASGYCEEDGIHGARLAKCSKCGREFATVPLLYPVVSKDYSSHPAIANSWRAARNGMSNAFMLTIFGYGAPKNDVAAMSLLSSSWGPPERRALEEIEIIDVRDEDTLSEEWEKFIFEFHYRVKRSFADSWIHGTPRRTGEAWYRQFLEAQWLTPNPLPRFHTMEQMWAWFARLLEVEGSAGSKD
jgi:hypothetical protein